MGNGNDAYGFTALPGGIRNIGEVYSDLTLAGYFWATDGSSVSYELHYNTSNLAQQTNIPGETAMSVRCVYDESNGAPSCGGKFYDVETQYCVEWGMRGRSQFTIADNVIVEGRVNCTVNDQTNPQIYGTVTTGSWCSVTFKDLQHEFMLCYEKGNYYADGQRCDVDFCFPLAVTSCTPAL